LKRLIFAALISLVLPVKAHAMECADFWSWVEAGCRHMVDTYEQGGNALLLSGYQWHLPYDWTPERRAEENENAWGGGWSRSRELPNGNTEDIFFLVFRDSHRQAQFNLGYAWRTYWGDRSSLQGGLGFTAAIIQRPDIAGGWPVPVVLPLATVRHQKVEILTSYIPKLNGGVNHGSVLYVFGKIDLK
jgi:lipid IVA palmitoyltransferase